jgi:hypothetical protein
MPCDASLQANAAPEAPAPMITTRALLIALFLDGYFRNYQMGHFQMLSNNAQIVFRP